MTDLRQAEANFRALARSNGRAVEDIAHATAIPFAAIEREPVEWLWPGRIPLGMLTMLVGDPGLGKSLLTIDLAARTTRAGAAVLLLSAEDSPSATIRPRLEAAQADLELAHNAVLRRNDVEEGFALPDDIEALAGLVERLDARLVVIDPLMAHLPGEVNSWRDQSVRTALAPLYRMANERACAVVIVLHLNKAKGADPLHRTGGSIGIPGAVRSALLLARDPDDPEGERGCQRVLAHIKSNVSPLAASLSYEVDPIVLPDDERIETARLRLLGESDHSGHDLLGVEHDPEKRSALDEAVEFLEAELGDGEQKARRVQSDARAAGITDRTLKRARQQLDVESERVGGAAEAGHWVWRLPKGATPKGAIPISEFGPLSANLHSRAENVPPESLRGPSETDNARAPKCSCFRPGALLADGRCERCFGVYPEERL
jgi:AAA domain